MDAFSLAIAYGTTNIRKNKIIILSLFVGIFHFFMPLLGSLIGNSYFRNLIISSNILVSIIFLVLAIEMLCSLKEEKKLVEIEKVLSMLLFSLTVSIDSFSVGIAIGITENNLYLPVTIFSLISCSFTFLGLNLGKYLNKKLGEKAIIIGIIILILLSVKYFLNI